MPMRLVQLNESTTPASAPTGTISTVTDEPAICAHVSAAPMCEIDQLSMSCPGGAASVGGRASGSPTSSLHENEPATAGVRYSRDGSFLRFLAGPGTRRQVESPDGVVREFEPDPFEAHQYRLVEIRDRLGNWVRVSYEGRDWVVTDLHGRTHRVKHSLVPGGGT